MASPKDITRSYPPFSFSSRIACALETPRGMTSSRDDFREELRKQGVEKPIEVEYVKPARSDKVQKIKTDKGIEIIIPVDYMNSRDFVEFKNQPDGTISIQLKNITRITSK